MKLSLQWACRSGLTWLVHHPSSDHFPLKVEQTLGGPALYFLDLEVQICPAEDDGTGLLPPKFSPNVSLPPMVLYYACLLPTSCQKACLPISMSTCHASVLLCHLMDASHCLSRPDKITSFTLNPTEDGPWTWLGGLFRPRDYTQAQPITKESFGVSLYYPRLSGICTESLMSRMHIGVNIWYRRARNSPGHCWYLSCHGDQSSTEEQAHAADQNWGHVAVASVWPWRQSAQRLPKDYGGVFLTKCMSLAQTSLLMLRPLS